MKLVKINEGAQVFDLPVAKQLVEHLRLGVHGYGSGGTGHIWEVVPISPNLALIECIGQGGCVVGLIGEDWEKECDPTSGEVSKAFFEEWFWGGKALEFPSLKKGPQNEG